MLAKQVDRTVPWGGRLLEAGLFKPRYECDAGPFPGREMGAGTGVAQLSRAFIIDDWGYFGLRTRLAELADDYRLWCDRISLKFHALDLVPDLAEDIGSARWFRGMATMFGLAALALLLWPNAAPVEAAQPMQIDDSSRDEFRSQMIMPLAFGGDSGRHMAANGFVVPLKSAPERPRIEMVATLAQGDSFARMLQRAGVGGAEAGMVESRIASSASLADLEPGTQVDVVLGRRTASGQPRPLDSLSFRARFDLQLSVHRSGSGFTVQPRPIHVDTTPLRIHGIVGASLYRSARAAGAPAKAVQQYLQAIDEQTDLESALGANDEYDLILSYKRAATGEVQVGDLLFGPGTPADIVLADGALRSKGTVMVQSTGPIAVGLSSVTGTANVEFAAYGNLTVTQGSLLSSGNRLALMADVDRDNLGTLTVAANVSLAAPSGNLLLFGFDVLLDPSAKTSSVTFTLTRWKG